MITQEFDINIVPHGLPPRVEVDQYDTGLRTLIAHIYQDDTPLVMTDEYTYTVIGTKPSGTGFSYPATAENGAVVIDVTGQMTVVSGLVECGIIVWSGNNRVGTHRFNLWVQPSALKTETIIDSDDFGSIIDDAVFSYLETDGAANLNAAIDSWLDEHPEATTTVEDHSLTYEKLVLGTLGYVTPQMFGAKGDGVTDDAAAINAALAYSYVIIPEGTYIINSNLAIRRSDITVKCLGTIKLSDTFSTSLPGLVIGNSSADVENVVVDGLVMDCSARPTVTAPDRVGNGIYIRTYTTNGVTYGCDGITLLNCTVTGNPRGYGIATGGAYDSNGAIRRNTRIRIEGCVSDNNYLAFATSCSEAELIGNYGANSAVENFTCDNYSRNCLFLHNTSYMSGNGACSMGGDNCSDCRWIGNIIDTPGSTAVTGTSNVGFTFNARDAAVSNCVVIGNHIKGFDRAIWLKNRVADGYSYSGDDCLFQGNTFEGNTYDLYLDAAAGYIEFSDNIYSSDISYSDAASLLAWVTDFVVRIPIADYVQSGFAINGSADRNCMDVIGREIHFNANITHSNRASTDVPIIFPAGARPKSNTYLTGLNVTSGTSFPVYIQPTGGLHCVGTVYSGETGTATYYGSFEREV